MPNKNGAQPIGIADHIIIETALYGPVSLYQDVEHNETMGYDKYAFEAQIGATYISFSTLEEAVTRLTMGDITIGEWLSEKKDLSLGGGLADFCDLDLSYMDKTEEREGLSDFQPGWRDELPVGEPYSLSLDRACNRSYVWVVDAEAKFGGRWVKPE
jgi:hypothetical protein